MSILFDIIAGLFAWLALYSLAAGFVCLEMNLDEHHWWCPLCHFSRILDNALARRF